MEATKNNGLQCITDRMPCCRTDRVGQWFFPEDVGETKMVPWMNNHQTTFYRNRGKADDGTVNLNRVNTSVMSPLGLFCCEVPDINNNTQQLCVEISEYIIILSKFRAPFHTDLSIPTMQLTLNCKSLPLVRTLLERYTS